MFASHTLRWLNLLVLLVALIPLSQAQVRPGVPSGDEEEARPNDIIPVSANAPSDADIARRLRDIYANLELMEGIRVSVQAGVVTLSGEVITKAAHEEALRLASQIEGVVEVEDKLVNVFDAQIRLRFAWERLVEGLIALVDYIPLIAVALLLLVTFWLLGRWIATWDWLFGLMTANPFLANLLRQITRGLLFLIGVLVALSVLDAMALLGALLGAAGLLALALGFALRDTVENYICTMLLSLQKPFDPHDFVSLGEVEGKVVRMTSSATILMTLDGNHLRVPNAMIWKGVLQNYSRNPERRFSFTLTLAQDADLTAARALAVEAMGRAQGVLVRPAPLCVISQFAAGGVELECFAWTNLRRFEFLKVRTAAIQAVKDTLAAEGFALADPSYRLHIESMSGKPLSVAVEPRNRLPSAGRPSRRGNVERVLDVRADKALDRRIDREAGEAGDLLSEESPPRRRDKEREGHKQASSHKQAGGAVGQDKPVK